MSEMTNKTMEAKSVFRKKEKWCLKFPGTKRVVDDFRESRKRIQRNLTAIQHFI